jgi:quercetin dioxygenase-like cupin family protein/DNA-binding transcriptional regulator YiaG
MERKNQTPHINVDFFEDLTGDITTPARDKIDDVGKKIRSLREKKALSIDDLSKMTGYDVNFLLKIEQNEIQPQLGTVMKLSKALDSAFSRLVSGVGHKLYAITRKNEQRTISRSTTQKGSRQAYVYKSLAPEVKGRHMEALIVQLETDPGGERSIHQGEEFIYVLDGIVALKIGGDEFELEPGDSAYYLSTTPHTISASREKATILAVMYEGC